MSAAQQYAFSYPPQPLSELESARSISRQVSLATDLQSGLAAILEVGLQTAGAIALTVEPSAALAAVGISLEWGSRPGPDQGRAVAPISSAGHSWGQIRIYFDLRTNTLESPSAFAHFLGQQIAALLNRFELEQRRQSLGRRVDALRMRLVTRKLAQRAAGIVAQRRCISEADALGLLTKYSRECRRSLHKVAEAVILSQEDSWNQRPVWRRLLPGELTFAPQNAGPAAPLAGEARP